MINRLDRHLSITGLLPPKASIIVAVSGGVDSVALLDLLTQLQPTYGWDIAVAHLDHKVRDTSADDAQLVADLARKYNLKYYLGQLDGNESREAALRKARYNYLEEIRAGHRANWVVTAHHRDDRIETSVFNTIRGADRYGMTAMRPVRGKIVRPLLPFRKGDLIAYAHARKLPFVEDETNVDQGYSRNFVRHSLLPLAARYDKDFHNDYIDRLDHLEQLNKSIESGLEQVLRYIDAGSEGDTLRINRDGFTKLSPVIQLNLIVHVARQLCPGIGLSDVNLAEAGRFLATAKTGSTKLVAGMLELRREYETLVFMPADDEPNTENNGRLMPLGSSGAHEFGRHLISVNSQDAAGDFWAACLKPDRYYVRNWLKGDRIYPVGFKGSKKLSDLFIDKKVPRPKRGDWPIVVNAQNEIAWVPGLTIDRRFASDTQSEHYYVSCEVI